MGQNWILVNLDKCEKEEFWKLGECASHFEIHNRLSGRKFTVRTAEEYIDMLREDAERQRKYREERAAGGWPCSPARPVPVYRRLTQCQSPFLTKLPVEAISVCIGFADTLRDKACFALTCQDAWDIARPQIVKDLRAYDTWQGDRILCLGVDTCIDDVPPNVLTAEELAVLHDVKTGKWRPRADDGSSLESCDPNHLGLAHFLAARGAQRFFSPKADICDWLDTHAYDDARSLFKQVSSLWSLLVRETRYDMDAAGAVLRNLTTHEFVRGDAFLAARADDPEGASPVHFWGLADILLLRIPWARDSDGRWEAKMQQLDPHGAWAGHRFDFAAECDLPCDEEGAVLPPWKDVTDELIGELLRCRGWAVYRPMWPWGKPF